MSNKPENINEIVIDAELSLYGNKKAVKADKRFNKGWLAPHPVMDEEDAYLMIEPLINKDTSDGLYYHDALIPFIKYHTMRGLYEDRITLASMTEAEAEGQGDDDPDRDPKPKHGDKFTLDFNNLFAYKDKDDKVVVLYKGKPLDIAKPYDRLITSYLNRECMRLDLVNSKYNEEFGREVDEYKSHLADYNNDADVSLFEEHYLVGNYIKELQSKGGADDNDRMDNYHRAKCRAMYVGNTIQDRADDLEHYLIKDECEHLLSIMKMNTLANEGNDLIVKNALEFAKTHFITDDLLDKDIKSPLYNLIYGKCAENFLLDSKLIDKSWALGSVKDYLAKNYKQMAAFNIMLKSGGHSPTGTKLSEEEQKFLDNLTDEDKTKIRSAVMSEDIVTKNEYVPKLIDEYLDKDTITFADALYMVKHRKLADSGIVPGFSPGNQAQGGVGR